MFKSRKKTLTVRRWLLCPLLVALGCSSSNNGAPGAAGNLATGGGTASGGSVVTGGTNAAAGGAQSSGGATAFGATSATGGVTATGGGVATGGATGIGTATTGGAIATGGASGTLSTGGAAVAGAPATGGKMATGGTTNVSTSGTGGLATGGAKATGGVGTGGAGTGGLATGGSGASTGGASNKGGTTSTGGSSSIAGGTSACAAQVISLSANGTGTASDTADAHVEATLGSDLPIGNANRTFEFWAFIKTTDWVGEDNEVYYYGSAGTAMAFGLDFGTNPVTGSTTNHATLNPFTNGGFTLDSTDNLGITSATNQWVHIAMTWDGTVLLVYVNGLPKITVNSTGGVTALATAQSVLSIGCNPTNNRCFSGEFAQFRVWNIARAAADIQANYNKPAAGNEAGLVAYWKFDDAPGAATAADSVTSAGHTAHPGTLKADTTAHLPTFVAPTTAVPLVCP